MHTSGHHGVIDLSKGTIAAIVTGSFMSVILAGALFLLYRRIKCRDSEHKQGEKGKYLEFYQISRY